MKEFPDRRGRLPYRLWYEESEIEDICERELESAGAPTLAGKPATDVDRLIESGLGIVPQFVFLPRGVLGATEFTAKGEMRLQISAQLSERADEQRSGERLLRSTMAHEAAHAFLHRILFLKESKALFGAVTTRTELCRDVAMTGAGYQGEWWEWQANRGMAALLMPRVVFGDWVRRWRQDNLKAGVTALREAAAEAFEVSTDAIKRRVEQLKAL